MALHMSEQEFEKTFNKKPPRDQGRQRHPRTDVNAGFKVFIVTFFVTLLLLRTLMLI